MKFLHLPAKKADDTDNVVRITNPKIIGDIGYLTEEDEGYVEGEETIDPSTVDSAGNPKPGFTFEIPATEFEYGQYETINEFYEDCGGEEKALAVLNTFKRDAALDAGKQKIRTTVTGSRSDILQAGLAATKNHNFLVSTELSASKSKDILLSLGGNLKDMDAEEIKKKLLAGLGIE